MQNMYSNNLWTIKKSALVLRRSSYVSKKSKSDYLA